MLKIVLSRRLQAVADMVSPCRCVADVGTDHGYLPIALVRGGIAERAIAMDVRKGPLARAAENIRKAGLLEKIDIRLSDGMEKLVPGEADAVVISGMGGQLICRILGRGLSADPGDSPPASIRELVLEPQSEVAEVRKYVTAHGFVIDREDMVLEDGKYYPVIHCRNCQETGKSGVENARRRDEDHIEKGNLSDMEAAFGPCLLRERHPVLLSYMKWRESVDHAILARLCEAGTANAAVRRKEVEEELQMIDDSCKIFDDKGQGLSGCAD